MKRMKIRKVIAASMGSALLLGAYAPVAFAQEQEQEQSQEERATEQDNQEGKEAEVTPVDLEKHGYKPHVSEVKEGDVDVTNARSVYDQLWTNNEFANGVRGNQEIAQNQVGSKALIEFLGKDGNAGNMSIKNNAGAISQHFKGEDASQRRTMVDEAGNLLPATPNNLTSLRLRQLAIAYQLAFDANDMKNEGKGITLTWKGRMGIPLMTNLDIKVIEEHPEFGSTLSFLYQNPFNFEEGSIETKPEKWGSWEYKGREQPKKPGDYFKQAAWLTAVDFDPELSKMDPDEGFASLKEREGNNMAGLELSNDAAALSDEMKAGKVETFVVREADGAVMFSDAITSMIASINTTLEGEGEINPEAKESLVSFKDAATKALNEKIEESRGEGKADDESNEDASSNNDDAKANADNVSGEGSNNGDNNQDGDDNSNNDGNDDQNGGNNQDGDNQNGGDNGSNNGNDNQDDSNNGGDNNSNGDNGSNNGDNQNDVDDQDGNNNSSNGGDDNSNNENVDQNGGNNQDGDNNQNGSNNGNENQNGGDSNQDGNNGSNSGENNQAGDNNQNGENDNSNNGGDNNQNGNNGSNSDMINQLIDNDWTGIVDNSMANSITIGSEWMSETDSQWYLRGLHVVTGEDGKDTLMVNSNDTVFSKKGDKVKIKEMMTSTLGENGKWILSRTDNPAEASHVFVTINGGDDLYTLSINSLISGEDFAQLARDEIRNEIENQQGQPNGENQNPDNNNQNPNDNNQNNNGGNQQ